MKSNYIQTLTRLAQCIRTNKLHIQDGDTVTINFENVAAHTWKLRRSTWYWWVDTIYILTPSLYAEYERLQNAEKERKEKS